MLNKLFSRKEKKENKPSKKSSKSELEIKAPLTIENSKENLENNKIDNSENNQIRLSTANSRIFAQALIDSKECHSRIRFNFPIEKRLDAIPVNENPIIEGLTVYQVPLYIRNKSCEVGKEDLQRSFLNQIKFHTSFLNETIKKKENFLDGLGFKGFRLNVKGDKNSLILVSSIFGVTGYRPKLQEDLEDKLGKPYIRLTYTEEAIKEIEEHLNQNFQTKVEKEINHINTPREKS